MSPADDLRRRDGPRFTPASVINDAPISFNVGGGQVWSPQNFEKRFGPTTVRQALTKSRNVVTVKLVSSMGMKYLLSYLPRFGFTRPFPKNLSIALGSSEVTLLEMTEAFGVFANLGMRVELRFITRDHRRPRRADRRGAGSCAVPRSRRTPRT